MEKTEKRSQNEKLVMSLIFIVFVAALGFACGRATAPKPEAPSVGHFFDYSNEYRWMGNGPVTVDNYTSIELGVDRDTFDKLKAGFEAHKAELQARNSNEVVLRLGEARREMSFDEFQALVEFPGLKIVETNTAPASDKPIRKRRPHHERTRRPHGKMPR